MANGRNNNRNMMNNSCPPGQHMMPAVNGNPAYCMDDNDAAMSNSTMGTNSTNSTMRTNSTSVRRSAPKINNTIPKQLTELSGIGGDSTTPPANISMHTVKTRKTRGGVSNQLRHQHHVMMDENDNGYTDTKILTGQKPHFHKVEGGRIILSGNPLHGHT